VTYALRGGTGLHYRSCRNGDPDAELRLGATLEARWLGQYANASLPIGAEVELDWPVSKWRLGGRAAVATQQSSSCNCFVNAGTSVGLRARRSFLVLGIDATALGNSHYAVLAGIGFDALP
jgi:hypothetical protein